MNPVNKIKFIDNDGTSVVLDVPMTARGERKDLSNIKEPMEEVVEEAVNEVVEEAVKEVVVKEAVNNDEIPKGCCIVQ